MMKHRHGKMSRRGLIAAVAACAGLADAASAQERISANLPDAPPHWPLALTMATGAAGSGFASFGPAWGHALRQAVPIPVAYRVSGGAAANILLIEQGAAQIGLTNLAVAAAAWQGGAFWTGGIALRGFRALFPIYNETLQIIASRSQRISTPADIAGATLGIGPAGSASAALVPSLLNRLGIIPSSFRNGDFMTQINEVLAGKLAACAFIEATALPGLVAAAKRGTFNLLGFTGAEVGAMREVSPALTSAHIPLGSLPGQTLPVRTIGSRAIAICRAGLPDTLAAGLTRAVLLHHPAPMQGLPDLVASARNWLADDTDIAVHPGAIPILRQAGIIVPDRLTRNRRPS
jgi:TRAP transporter TAXI family solute receptor